METAKRMLLFILQMKIVLLSDFFRNNSSVDDVPSQRVTPFESFINKMSEFSHSTVQLVDNLVHVFSVPVLTLQQGGWITVHKRRFFLKEQLDPITL